MSQPNYSPLTKVWRVWYTAHWMPEDGLDWVVVQAEDAERAKAKLLALCQTVTIEEVEQILVN